MVSDSDWLFGNINHRETTKYWNARLQNIAFKKNILNDRANSQYK